MPNRTCEHYVSGSVKPNQTPPTAIGGTCTAVGILFCCLLACQSRSTFGGSIQHTDTRVTRHFVQSSSEGLTSDPPESDPAQIGKRKAYHPGSAMKSRHSQTAGLF